MTTKLKSVLLAGTAVPLLAIASMAGAAEPRGIVLAQAQSEAAPAELSAEERERRRAERRMKRQEARKDDQSASPSPSAPPAAPPPGVAQSTPAPSSPPASPPAAAEAKPPVPPPAAAPAARADEPRRPPGTAAQTGRPGEREGRPGRRRGQSDDAQATPSETKPPAAASDSTPSTTTATPAPTTTTATPSATPAPSTTTATPSAPPAITQSTAPPPAAAEERRARRLGDLRGSRRESREDGRLVIHEGGRTMIRDGDRTIIRYNEADRFRVNARDVSVQRRGGDTVTTVVRPNGTRIVTVVDENGRLLRRSRIESGDREVVIIDNRRAAMGGPRPFVHLPPPRVRIPRDRYVVAAGVAPPQVIYETLMAPPVEVVEEAYGLDEIRYSAPVRDRMRRIDIDTITFASGSWEVVPGEAAKLDVIAEGMLRAIRGNPAEVFLIEGHTDAVGSEIDNLSLSDRRAEQVAIVLTDRFGVPAENLTTQGYGEEFLKVPTQGPERQNRRVAIRRITPLLGGAPATAQR